VRGVADPGDAPLAVHHEGGGDAVTVRGAVPGPGDELVLRVPADVVVHLVAHLRHERVHARVRRLGVLALLQDIDADDGDPSSVFPGQAGEAGHHEPAGSAPGGPEFHHVDLAGLEPLHRRTLDPSDPAEGGGGIAHAELPGGHWGLGGRRRFHGGSRRGDHDGQPKTGSQESAENRHVVGPFPEESIGRLVKRTWRPSGIRGRLTGGQRQAEPAVPPRSRERCNGTMGALSYLSRLISRSYGVLQGPVIRRIRV